MRYLKDLQTLFTRRHTHLRASCLYQWIPAPFYLNNHGRVSGHINEMSLANAYNSAGPAEGRSDEASF